MAVPTNRYNTADIITVARGVPPVKVDLGSDSPANILYATERTNSRGREVVVFTVETAGKYLDAGGFTVSGGMLRPKGDSDFSFLRDCQNLAERAMTAAFVKRFDPLTAAVAFCEGSIPKTSRAYTNSMSTAGEVKEESVDPFRKELFIYRMAEDMKAHEAAEAEAEETPHDFDDPMECPTIMVRSVNGLSVGVFSEAVIINDLGGVVFDFEDDADKAGFLEAVFTIVRRLAREQTASDSLGKGMENLALSDDDIPAEKPVVTISTQDVWDACVKVAIKQKRQVKDLGYPLGYFDGAFDDIIRRLRQCERIHQFSVSTILGIRELVRDIDRGLYNAGEARNGN